MLKSLLPTINSLYRQLAAAFFVIPLVIGIFLYIEIKHFGRQVTETSSFHLMRKGREDVFHRIDAYLKLPESIVRHNAILAGRGLFPLSDDEKLSRIFFSQVVQEPSIDFLFFANEAGGIASVGRNAGRYLFTTTPGMKQTGVQVRRVDGEGRFVAHEKTIRFDPRQREWYRSAKTGRRQFWSQPYAGAFEATLAISTAYPVINSSGKLIGVFGGDILLDKLASFLQSVKISPHSYAFLTEADGTLIASSIHETLFKREGSKLVRLNVRNSENPLILEAASMIEKMKTSGQKEAVGTLLKDEKGNSSYVDISHYQFSGDINWLLTIVVPRVDFTLPLDNLLRKLMLLALLGLAASLILSRLIGRWIARPIDLMKDQVKEVAGGRFGGQVAISRTDEIGALGNAFNQMSTQLGKTYEELQIAKEAAESASRVKSEFLDIAAHELRTPLTPITLFVQTAQHMLASGIEVPASFFDRIGHQVERLTRLIDDLLNLSRLERGGFPLRKVSADLISIVRESLENFKMKATMRPFTYEGPEEPVPVEVDPDRIHQVLANLLDNALKYSPEGSPIEVRVVMMEEKIRTSVTDHGPGISKEQQQDLFSKFYRTKNDVTIRQPGLGLGLYICRRIVELHGGSIDVESDLGKGSTFWFTLSRRNENGDRKTLLAEKEKL